MSYAIAYKAAAAAADLTPAGWPAGWDFPGLPNAVSSPPLAPGYDKFPAITVSSGTGVQNPLSGSNTLRALGTIRHEITSPGAVLTHSFYDYMYFDGLVLDLTEIEYVEIPVAAATNFITAQENYANGTTKMEFRLSGCSTDFDITAMTTIPTTTNNQDLWDMSETTGNMAHQNDNYYLLQSKLLVDAPALAAAYGLELSIDGSSVADDPRGSRDFNWDGGSIYLYPPSPSVVLASTYGMITSATPTVFNSTTKTQITASRHFILKFDSTVTNYDAYNAFRCPMDVGSSTVVTGKVYAKWILSAIDTATVSWNSQPTLGSAFELYQNTAVGDYIPLPPDPSADIYGLMIYCDSTMDVDVRDANFRLV